MSRPAVKNAVRLALFVAAIATAACSEVTSPTSTIDMKKGALTETVPGDTTGYCRSGWVIQLGRWTCDAAA